MNIINLITDTNSIRSRRNRGISCVEILEFEGREYLALGGDKSLEVFELQTNLKAVFLFELLGSVFSLFWAETYLVVGSGKLKNKQMNGLPAQVILFHRQDSMSRIRSTVQSRMMKKKKEAEQNAFSRGIETLNSEDLSVRTTKTSFFCMFGTSIGGFKDLKNKEKHVAGVWDEQRSFLIVENLDSGMVTKIKAHTMTIYSIGIESKKSLMVTGGWDKNLAVWSLKDNGNQLELQREGYKEGLHDSWINHIQVLRIKQNLDYKIVLTGGFDHKVKMLSIFTLEELMTFEFTQRVLDCCFIEDKLLVIGEHPKRIRIFYEPDILQHKKETLKTKIKDHCRARAKDTEEIRHLRCLLWESEEIIEELESEHLQVHKRHMKQKQKTKMLKERISTMSEGLGGKKNVFALGQSAESHEHQGKSPIELVRELVSGNIRGLSGEDAKKYLAQIKLLVEKE